MALDNSSSAHLSASAMRPANCTCQPRPLGTVPGNHHPQPGARHRVQQHLQALVVAQHADKEKEAFPHLRTPRLQPRGLCALDTCCIYSDRNDAHPWRELAEQRTATHIGLGRRDDTVDRTQESAHEGSIDAPEQALAHDIGMVGEHRLRARVPRDQEMENIRERPWEMVMDNVRPARPAPECTESAQEHVTGGDFEQFGHAADAHPIDLDFLHTSHLARGTKHHHIEAIARKPAGKRANHILEPTLGIGKVGTIDVQDSNHRLATRFVAPRFATGHEYGEKRLCEGKFRWIPHPSRMVAAARPVICATP